MTREFESVGETAATPSPAVGRLRALVVFTRSPEAEARAKRLPSSRGARLFEAFLQGWRLRAAQVGAELIVSAPGSSLPELKRLTPGGRMEVQRGASFGERVEKAFARAFEQGAGAVLMVSGDAPPLDAEETEAAFAHLERDARAMVLTPAADGGVNAIGFGAAAERSLACLDWLGPRVCAQLLALAARLGRGVLLTEPGRDLDSARDVRALCRFSRLDPRWRVFRGLLRALRQSPPRIDFRPFRRAGKRVAEPRLTRGPPSA